MKKNIKKNIKKKSEPSRKSSIKFVTIPADEYNRLVEIVEDYGLGIAMKDAKKDGFVNREEALRRLNEDEDRVCKSILERSEKVKTHRSLP